MYRIFLYKFYKWLKRRNVETSKDIEDEFIIEKIKELYKIHKCRYGIDRMTPALEQDYNIKYNHKKIYRLMKENNLLSVIKAKKTYIAPGEPHPKQKSLGYLTPMQFKQKQLEKQNVLQ